MSSRKDAVASPSKQLADFIARYHPTIAQLTRAARAKLRRRMPTAVEMIYDNYNALVIGYSSSERASDVIVSLALYPRWVNLFFLYGATLPDPERVLQGNGNQVRRVMLTSAEDLDRPEIRALLDHAIEDSEPPLPKRGKGYTVIKAISTKQRPRRPVPKLNARKDRLE